MTMQRLYYTDSYTTSFEARLISQFVYQGAPAVVLDRTCFYPTSGGQPHDTGHLNGVPVTDVVIDEADGAVLHVLARELAGQQVSGVIDWARRFDHMQQHTGQHILSQAFVRLAKADTVGFHLSPDSVTIDLNKPGITPSTIDAAEHLANQVVTGDRPVAVRFPTEDEQAALELRKVPEVEGQFRVIEIEDFDLNACGGTHVARTGEVGLIKILRTERRGDVLRVEFCCGGRALADYRQKNALLNQVAAEMTTAYTEIPAILHKLREENKQLQREMRAVRASLLEYEAEQLWQAAGRVDGCAWIVRAFDGRDTAEVRQLVQLLIRHPGTVALCGSAGEKAQLILGRSDDLDYDLVPALLRGLAVWQVDRGGGRPSFAQGGGAAATLTEVEAALRAVVESLQQ